MEKLEPNPDQLRLRADAIRRALRENKLLPSSYIRIMEEEPEREFRYVMFNVYCVEASSDFKEKVKKVREALRILQEFDITELENTSL